MKHKRTASTFVHNIQKAMRVCGKGVGDYPTKMTQAVLSKEAGIARSTLAHHQELSNDDSRSPNPTLEKICNIAETLHVPPAFLLMRPEDWTRLAQAIDYYAKLRSTNRTHPLLSKIADGTCNSPDDQAMLALKLAKIFEVDGGNSQEILDSLSMKDRQALIGRADARRLSIYATTALPPIQYMNEDERLAAFVVSLIFGAHHRSEETAQQ